MTTKKEKRNKAFCDSYKASNTRLTNKKEKVIHSLKHQNASLSKFEYKLFSDAVSHSLDPSLLNCHNVGNVYHLRGYGVSALVQIWRHDDLASDVRHKAMQQVKDAMKLHNEQLQNPSVNNQTKINGLWKSIVLYFVPEEPAKVIYTSKVKTTNPYGHIAPWWQASEKPAEKTDKSAKPKKHVKQPAQVA